MATGLAFKGGRPAGFSAAYGASSTNFMTPDIHGYATMMLRDGRRAIVELSSGYGIRPGTTIWGVSVAVQLAPGSGRWERDNTLSKCCSSRAEAERYIAQLQRDVAGDEVQS